MSRAFTILCVLVVAMASPSHAAPRVLLIPLKGADGVSDQSAERFSQVLSEELKSRSDAFELVPPPATSSAPEPDSGPKGPDKTALAALAAGLKAFDDLAFDDATTQLSKGIEGLLRDPASADFEQVLDGYVKLSAAYFRMGEEKKAKQMLGDLARLSPKDFALPAGYPPIFQREFDKARKRLDKKPRGQVVIEGPSGATAFLDGRDLGMVPVTESGVAAGTHYVKVEAARGGAAFGQSVEVMGGVSKVKATISGGGGRKPANMASDPHISRTLDQEMVRRVSDYAKAAGADFAVFGVVSRASDSQLAAGTAIFHVKRQSVAVLPQVKFDADVVSAAPEAFRLADELGRRVGNLGEVASLPHDLATTPQAGTSSVVVARSGDTKGEIEVRSPGRKTILVPQDDIRALDRKSNLVDLDNKDLDGKKTVVPDNVNRGVPAWVWVVTGVAVAAGAGVGGYFAYDAATRPVTGTVNATW